MTQTPADQLAIFALRSSGALGEAVCERLGQPQASHEEREFEDGEHKTRPLESVRGKDVYVIASLHSGPGQSVNDKLCRLLFFMGAIRDAGASRLTAVAPYLCYMRKDRRTKPRDPLTTRYVAQLFEAIGADRVVTLDVHNIAAFENAFRVVVGHIEARRLIAAYLAPLIGDQSVVVVSPDTGGVKRAERFREAIEQELGRAAGLAFMEKKRSEGEVSGEAFAGEVEGRVAVVIDDLIASGGTLERAAKACLARGARAVYAAATHGVFTADASRVIEGSAFERVVVTNTVDPLRITPALLGNKVVVLDVAPLIAEAIRRLHSTFSSHAARMMRSRASLYDI